MSADKHLLVDAYNIIHAWPHLKKALKINWEIARDQLAEEVRVLHDFDGYRISIVLDGKGDRVDIERPTDELTFSYVYAPSGISADAVIEQIVSNSKKPKNVTVASGDVALAQTVFALGAHAISPKALLEWTDRTQARQSDWIDKRND